MVVEISTSWAANDTTSPSHSLPLLYSLNRISKSRILKMLLYRPSISTTETSFLKTHKIKSLYAQPQPQSPIITMKATDAVTRRTAPPRPPMSAVEARVSLVLALASQTLSLSQRLMIDLASETAKYIVPNSKFESRNFEEALMSVPDLETVEFKILSRNDQYEIREVKPYVIAETTMPGKYGFDFTGASQSFNVLAEYLFGKNTRKEQMEMTTPVFTRKVQSVGEKMEMTTPVITKKVEDQDKWKMSFVMPSKYGSNLPLPKDSSVTIKEVPRKIIAVVAFSGFITDEEVERRESRLRDLLNNDTEFRVKEGALVEVAQYNPPFTLPFMRRNEISLEVERKQP